MTIYKCLKVDGVPANGGKGIWSLPTKNTDGTWTAGDWMPKVEDIVLCERGYHGCELKDVLKWASDKLYVMETRGAIITGDDKIVAQEARLLSEVEAWNDRTLRLFACDCAERTLPLFETERPDDTRPRLAIETARRFADGKATREELATARSAAWSAAESAAGYAAESAAWSAARSAAWYAALYAAWSAAESAAGYAAESAAWSAAESAAWYAAWYAAWSAAESAEHEWQTQHLAEMLGIHGDDNAGE
jgi:hypothetical protein